MKRFVLRTRILLAAALVVGSPGLARAGPLKTWGNEPPDKAETTETRPSEPPPPPPTSGTPVFAEGSEAEHPSEPSPGIVRASGKVGLKYVLEGVQVRGNTSTLARVILRFVPFHAGDTLDVDDKELLLTRFRLLGTGF